MNAAWMIDQLERFPAVLRELLAGISSKDALWRPSDTDWSIIEIVCHLVDEDLEDFGQRLRLLLESPDADWPKIDPSAAAIERGYRKRDLDKVVQEFTSVRGKHIKWLRSMKKVDYSIAARHPRLVHPRHGAMTAGDLLASWCAHDALHLRQIAKRLHQLTEEKAGTFDIGYAGDW